MLSRPATRLAPLFRPTLSAPLHSTPSSFSAPKPPSPPLPKKPSPREPYLTASELASKQLEETNTPPAPYLTRALGLPSPPSRVAQTKEEWRASLLSRERRLDERKHLVQQVAKGYFHDYNELRHQGGKAWVAPNTLIREDVSTKPGEVVPFAGVPERDKRQQLMYTGGTAREVVPGYRGDAAE